jgi:hypothetical protein
MSSYGFEVLWYPLIRFKFKGLLKNKMKINENIAKQEKIHKKNCQPPMVKFVWKKVEECKDRPLAWGSLFFGRKLEIGHDQLFQPHL